MCIKMQIKVCIFQDKIILNLIYVFLLEGHKVDFITPCGAIKSTLWPASRKKHLLSLNAQYTIYLFKKKKTI